MFEKEVCRELQRELFILSVGNGSVKALSKEETQKQVTIH